VGSVDRGEKVIPRRVIANSMTMSSVMRISAMPVPGDIDFVNFSGNKDLSAMGSVYA